MAEPTPVPDAPTVGASGWSAQRFEALLREHPGFMASAAYVGATAVGMLSSWAFYGRFGVDVFEYAQLSDFLLAAVRTPMATLAILLAFPVVWAILRSDEWLARRFPRFRRVYGTERIRALMRSTFALLVYFVAYMYVFAIPWSAHAAGTVREGGSDAVVVQLQSGTYLGRDATRPFDAVLLGTTSGWVFLLDPGRDAVTAVPTENLGSLRLR